ncbi:MAG: HtaA domain-containing protein [Solirubrobacterales bacterium]
MLRRYEVRQRLIAPASNFTGRPIFPLKSAGIRRDLSRVLLGGGLRLSVAGSRRQVVIESLALVLRPGRALVVNARVAGRRILLFKVRGGRRSLDLRDRILNLSGSSVTLSDAAANRIVSKLDLPGSKSIWTGHKWGVLTVFAARNNRVKDPVAETPPEPQSLERPIDSAELASATIQWRVRESFIRYLAVGEGTSVANGATADPPEDIGGAGPLVYGFSFPFTDGWAAPGSGPAVVHGSGRVGFRHCRNTINFTAANPEIELNGDADSRLIFRVDGTDGTAFPDSRAVMVQLVPSLATKTVVGNTTTLSGIPGYVPQAATGIFADFYSPFPGSVDAPGADLSRFGSITVSYTTE